MGESPKKSNPPISSGVVNYFKQSLENLKLNDKRVIDALTKVAGIGHSKANEIVKIIMNCDCPNGLVKLYLIDSIIKNIGGSYVALFNNNDLVDSFRTVFLSSEDNCKSKLFKLRLTWEGIVSADTLYVLDKEINQLDKGWPIKLNLDDKTQSNQPTNVQSKHCSNADIKVLEDVSLGPVNSNFIEKPLHLSKTIFPKKTDVHHVMSSDGKVRGSNDRTVPIPDEKFSGTHGVVRKTRMEDAERKPLNVHAVSSAEDFERLVPTEKNGFPLDAVEKIPITVIVKDFLLEKIETGEKKVEVRPATDNFNRIEAGDTIKFNCADKSVNRTVISKYHYDTFEQLLQAEGVDNCLPGATSLTEAVDYYRSFPSYASMESSCGVLAFRLQSQVYDCSGSNQSCSGVTSTLKLNQKFLEEKGVDINANSMEPLWEEFDFDIPSTQDLMRSAIVPTPSSQSTDLMPKASRKIAWIQTSFAYEMSEHLFNVVYNTDTHIVNRESFLHRKDSIGIEIEKLFSGCVIYIEKYNCCKKFWKLRAYCAHKGCRRYILTAQHSSPRSFTIEVDQLEILHKGQISRQLRRYERQEAISQLEHTMPRKLRAEKMNAADDDVVEDGNYQVPSVDVYQKARSQALQKQDRSTDDIDDVESMRTGDPKTNFISNTLSRKQFAVYIHSKRQHDILHKLHAQRPIYGTQIVGRLDASGNIARAIECGLLLYYALTSNIRIKDDKKTTPLPFSEQFNVKHTSVDIARWLFDFVLSHASFYEDHPLLFDWMVTDFSYANFHAILKAFNSISLKSYLNLTKKWISYKLVNGEFPEDFFSMVKVRMCYTHLMHTFALMMKRMYGKNKNKQLPQSRIILEVLATMINTTDYLILLQCWEQLTVLLKNEHVNDSVSAAISEINKLKESDINLDDYDEEKLQKAIDVEELPEHDETLYKSNLYYLQFTEISDNVRAYHYNNDQSKTKNIYYNPELLQKLLVRFVPLIPLWTNILSYESKATSDKPPPLSVLEAVHNQPIENYFGDYKGEMEQSIHTIGRLPVKMGRAITFSQNLMTSTIKSINCLIPKQRLNTQTKRKAYTKRGTESIEVVQRPIDTTETTGIVQQRVDLTEPINVLQQLADTTESIEVVQRPIDTTETTGIVQQRVDTPKKTNQSRVQPKKSTNNENVVSFSESQESFNKKRPVKNFTYFQGRQMKKAANKQVLDSHTENLKTLKVFKNGLWQDVKLYCDLDIEFIVCKKNKLNLSNKSFDCLNPQQPLPEPLMMYLLNALPRTTKSILCNNGNFDYEIQSDKKIRTEFIVSSGENGWNGLLIDHKRKLFGMLIKNEVVAEKLISRLRSENYAHVEFEGQTSNDWDSGIWVYKRILTYLSNGSTATESDFCPDSFRVDLQKKITKESDNISNDCLICGSPEADMPMGECTCCRRWVHCHCVKLTEQEIIKNEKYKCPICEQIFV